MIVNTRKMLLDAKRKNKCVFHFNINNLEWTKYILEECDELNIPVIIGVSEGAIKYMGGYFVVASLVKALDRDLKIKVPVAIHLDHGSSYDSCKKAINAGFTSVMIDASHLEYKENVKETKRVVDYAHRRKVTVEAEIGHVGGIEDGKASSVLVTTFEDCRLFVKDTNIDSLAPAIGTVHGIYKGELNIDYDLIEECNKGLKVPLVMHGGSGLDNKTIRKCVKCGINKINVNSDIQAAWHEDVLKFVENNKNVYDPRKVIGSGEDAIKRTVKEKYNIIGG